MKITSLFTIPSAIISFIAGIISILEFLSNMLVSHNCANGEGRNFLFSPSIYIYLSAYFCSVLLVWFRILYEHRIVKHRIKNRDIKHEGIVMLLVAFSLWSLFYIPSILGRYADGYTSKLLLGLPLGTIFVCIVSSSIYELIRPYNDYQPKK